jgi:glycosyltransferase involved in cell wall biosynthesis
LDRNGVGGGITSRIRLAHALAELGHKVTLYVNCPQDNSIKGVTYLHFSKMKNVQTDIFIAASSGGDHDLGIINEMEIHSRIKIVMLQGVTPIQKLNYDLFDYYYVPSNFIRTFSISTWNLQPEKFFVSYRGVTETNFRSVRPIKRDPFRLVYLGHPIKGLETARVILRKLREKDQRFTLHIYGGNQLWGGPEEVLPAEPGVFYHGICGQKELAREIQKATFSLNLQDIREAFGMAVIESMKAGCIVLASPVGSYNETVRNGFNGFLVPGDHTREETRETASGLILDLVNNPEICKYIQKNAINTPMDWQTIARTWEEHWDSVLIKDHKQKFTNGCASCKGDLLAFSDGYHCLKCGNYQTSLQAPFSNQAAGVK